MLIDMAINKDILEMSPKEWRDIWFEHRSSYSKERCMSMDDWMFSEMVKGTISARQLNDLLCLYGGLETREQMNDEYEMEIYLAQQGIEPKLHEDDDDEDR